MAAVKGNKLYSELSRGLITEASALTFPDKATSDELNMTLPQTGNRNRRYGINYSATAAISLTQAAFALYAVSEFKWVSANNTAGSDFICVQVGSNLQIFTLTGTLLTTIDLTTFTIAGATTAQVAINRQQMTSGNGFLFSCGRYTEPFVVVYDGSTFTATRLYVLIRDFVGVDDGLGPDVEPATLSNAHKYNLQNQGWLVGYNAQDGASVTIWTAFGQQTTQLTSAASVIDSFHTDVGRYPSNSKLWWWAQKASFNIDPLSLTNLPAGNILAPKGHYVVNAFNIDRTAVSSVASITAEVQTERPTTVGYFAGRVWWAFKSTVYFSRVLDPNKYYKANFCCMEADPTSQKISDLIATDGGTVLIPSAGTIVKIYPVGSGMLVFATNGVWFIQGGQGSFSATDFSVSKMSPVGMNSPASVIEVDSQIFWMSDLGIQGMAYKNGIFGPIQGNFDKLNISQNTVQSFYTENIPQTIRTDVKAVYDPSLNTIQWLYRSGTLLFNEYDSALCLDLNFQAFYPWKFSTPGVLGPYVVGAVTAQTPSIVTVNGNARPSQVIYISVVPSSSNYTIAFATLNDSTFADWRFFNGVGVTYTSFLESGFEILQDAERKKWLPYLFTYLNQTETGITTPDGGITWVPTNTSSCLLTVKWSWTNSAVANRWTTPIEVYHPDRVRFIDFGAPVFTNGQTIVQRKNKIRGNGKAVQFRFENSQIGKDMDVVGWATEYSGDSVP